MASLLDRSFITFPSSQKALSEKAGLNTPVKSKDYETEFFLKSHLPEENTYIYEGGVGSKVKRYKKIYHVNTNREKAGMVLLTSDKADLWTRHITRDKEDPFKMINGSFYLISTILQKT